MSNRGQRPRIRTQREASAWRAVRQRIGLEDRYIICKERFISVYRLDEDGDLHDEGGVQSFGLGVKSSLL